MVSRLRPAARASPACVRAMSVCRRLCRELACVHGVDGVGDKVGRGLPLDDIHLCVLGGLRCSVLTIRADHRELCSCCCRPWRRYGTGRWGRISSGPYSSFLSRGWTITATSSSSSTSFALRPTSCGQKCFLTCSVVKKPFFSYPPLFLPTINITHH